MRGERDLKRVRGGRERDTYCEVLRQLELKKKRVLGCEGRE